MSRRIIITIILVTSVHQRRYSCTDGDDGDGQRDSLEDERDSESEEK
jgi:hypothetical protein